MKKLKIYYLLSKEAELKPLSGDRINEINIIRSMCKYFDVYYNGELCKLGMKSFGRKDKSIVIPNKGEYDLVYIRNNPDVFLKSPHPKLWFASPYNKECFRSADGIVCMTIPWKERLSKYTKNDFKYFEKMYPEDMEKPKKCILFPQVIELFDENKIKEIKKERNKPPKRSFFKNLFKKNKNKSKKIRHFGPIRLSNFPHQLGEILETNTNIDNSISFECIGAGKKMKIPKKIINSPRVPQEEAFKLLINSDAIWYNQNESGNFAGSLKVLEAMAAGVPILLPRYDARECELGKEYPFFWDIKKGTTIKDLNQPDLIKKLEQIISIGDKEKEEWFYYLRNRVNKHSTESSSEILYKEINSFMEGIENE